MIRSASLCPISLVWEACRYLGLWQARSLGTYDMHGRVVRCICGQLRCSRSQQAKAVEAPCESPLLLNAMTSGRFSCALAGNGRKRQPTLPS